jgi:AcrR family transcriptional regulator
VSQIARRRLDGSSRRPSGASRQERLDRELRQRRASILSVARDLIESRGIGGFTMERLADEAGYARTQIYRFFSNKRELVIDLATESLELRRELCRRALQFEARPRERIVAFGEVTALLYPRYVLPQVFALAYSDRAQKSDAQLERLRALHAEDQGYVLAVVGDAVERGDLDLSFGMTPEETVFAMHAMTQGIFEHTGGPNAPPLVSDPRLVMRRAGGRLLDGMGWRPLSHQWDYRVTMARIYGEVFTPQLLATLGLAESVETRREDRRRSEV